MSRRWHLVVLRGVVALVFGASAIVWPQITVLALALLWGTYMLLDGIASIAMGMARGTDRMYMIILGVLGIAACIATYVWPCVCGVGPLRLIAAWDGIPGVVQVAAAVRLCKVIRNEWFLVISGVVTL